MLDQMINLANFRQSVMDYGNNPPFDHVVIDNFFKPDIAAAIAAEFPEFDDPLWHVYDNPIEVKKVCNNWNLFPPLTYRVFSLFNSDEFLALLSETVLKGEKLYADPGLNGGGWHIHRRGGKLNTHLDYSIHPKLLKERKLNIIVYMNPHWQPEWGGALGLWGNESAEKPGDLVKSVNSTFNRAVIFDTTQNSWHGLPTPLNCPDNQARKSLAAYFLREPDIEASKRGKALFAPTEEQQNDEQVLDLIKKRSSVETAASVYKK